MYLKTYRGKTCFIIYVINPLSLKKMHYSLRKKPKASAKCIDQRQIVQSAQSDMDRNFLIFVNFSHKNIVLSVVIKEDFLSVLSLSW